MGIHVENTSNILFLTLEGRRWDDDGPAVGYNSRTNLLRVWRSHFKMGSPVAAPDLSIDLYPTEEILVALLKAEAWEQVWDYLIEKEILY